MKENNSSTVEIEPGLVVEVNVDYEDVRLGFAVAKLQKLGKSVDLMDSDSTMDMFLAMNDLILIVLGERGLNKVERFYVDKYGKFTAEHLSTLIEKVFSSEQKK